MWQFWPEFYSIYIQQASVDLTLEVVVAVLLLIPVEILNFKKYFDEQNVLELN